MLDIFLVVILAILVLLGLRHPIIAFGAYMWADLMTPQSIAFGMASTIPYSNIFAALTILSILINRKRLSQPTSWYILLIILLFLLWTQVTQTFSVNPVIAAFKLSWVTKSLGFSLVALVIVNSKATIEYFLLLFTTCVSYFSFSAGVKTMIGGGGYGLELVRVAANNGLAESSTLAGVATACIPFILFFYKYSTIFPPNRYFKFACICGLAVFLFGIIGTFARTGLVCLFILFSCGFLISKKKVLLIFTAVVVMIGLVSFAGEDWRSRMGTIFDEPSVEDDGTLHIIGRTEVWLWTLDYSTRKPLGGGMDSYLENLGELAYYSKAFNVETQTAARAFHNIYMEVLGEQGYPGLFLYLSVLILSIARLFRLRKPENWNGADPETTAWATNLSTACLVSFAILLTMGMFVGVAYRLYVFVPVIAASGLSYMNRQYLREYLHDNPLGAIGRKSTY